MDFRLSDVQLALRDTVVSYCRDHADLATVADREGRPADGAAWAELAQIGVLGLLAAEDGDEDGGGAVEAAIAFEQLGRHLCTGPLLWTAIAAPLIPGAATGERRVTGIQVDAAAPGPVVVEHALESDVLLLLHDDRVEQCATADLPDPLPGEPLDPLTPTAVYESLPAGTVIGGPREAARLRLAGTVLSAAMLVGLAQGALDAASDYALQRHQFGVPIGSFQAVKHLLADMYVRTSLARSAAYAAAAVLDNPRAGEPERAASSAKLLAGEAGLANGRTAIQIFGGMGFTWEMIPHYYLKRAWVLEQAFGVADSHALHLADTLAAEVAAEAKAG